MRGESGRCRGSDFRAGERTVRACGESRNCGGRASAVAGRRDTGAGKPATGAGETDAPAGKADAVAGVVHKFAGAAAFSAGKVAASAGETGQSAGVIAGRAGLAGQGAASTLIFAGRIDQVAGGDFSGAGTGASEEVLTKPEKFEPPCRLLPSSTARSLKDSATATSMCGHNCIRRA